MKYLLSYLEVPIKFQLENWGNCKLKDNMTITAKPLYKTIEIEFTKIHNLIKSDYRQYSPFEFAGGAKKSENWYNDNQNILVMDIDEDLSIVEAKEMFKEYKYLIATTKSHQVEKKGLKCDRFRVILSAVDVPIGDDYFKAMRALERKYPFIDKQVNNKTGAFLGSADCEYWYNEGKDFSLKEYLKSSLRLEEVAQTFKEEKQPIVKPQATYSDEIDIQAIKNRLTRETVADIISSCGFEVNRKFMFKARPDERTASASISSECVVKDFGDQDAFSDIFGFLMHTQKMNFKEACEYVGSFVGITFNQNENINMAVL